MAKYQLYFFFLLVLFRITNLNIRLRDINFGKTQESGYLSFLFGGLGYVRLKAQSCLVSRVC